MDDEQATAKQLASQYREAAARAVDLDVLHDIVVKWLARHEQPAEFPSLPYLRVAMRHRAIDVYRRQSRERWFDERIAYGEAEVTNPLNLSSASLDPLEILLENDTLRTVFELLSELPREDALLVVRRAESTAFDEIAKELKRKGYGSPTGLTLRKRHRRVLDGLRRRAEYLTGVSDLPSDQDSSL